MGFIFTFGFGLFVVVVGRYLMSAADVLQTTSLYTDNANDVSLHTNPFSENTTRYTSDDRSSYPERSLNNLKNNTHNTSVYENTVYENTTHRDTFTETPILLDTSSNDLLENNTSGDIFVKGNMIDANNYMEKISTPIAAIVGITGNTATIIALQGHPFSTIPSSKILVSLAVADSMTLILIQFNKEFVINLIGYDVRAINRAGCKIFNFTLRFAKMLSAWFVVQVCLERFVVICLPFRTKLICTKANALKGIAIIVAVAVFYCGVWTLNSELDQSQCHPSFSTPETKLREKVIIIIGSALIGILPMIILIIVTPVMCFVLFRQRKAGKDMLSTHTPDVTKISSMLIALCVTYVFLQLPLIVAHNIASARDENLYTTEYLPLVILNKMGTILEAINYSCNFFLYIVCNRVFRRKVSSFCPCCFRKRCENTRSYTAPRISDIASSTTSVELNSSITVN